jgi:hypothetical protein
MSIRPSIALGVFAFLLLTPGASLAVTVHGLTSQPAGSATLTVTGGSSTGYALEIDNIGSSGQDGVSISLPGLNGLALYYGSPSSPGDPLVHRDLECRAVSGGSIESLAHLIEDRDLMGLRTYLSVPGSPDVTIEAWNGPDLVYSAVHPAGTEVTAAGIAIDEPGVQVTMSFEAEVKNGVTIRSVNATVTRSPIMITIAGDNFVAGRYVLRAGIPLATTIGCSSAQILCATDGSGGGGGGGAVGRLAIKTKGLPGPKNRHEASATVSALTGAVLESAPSGGEVSRLHVTHQEGDPDRPVLRLNGLPPGTPYIGELSHYGLPPGEPYIGSLRLNGLPPGEPYLGKLSMAVQPDFLTDTPGQSLTIHVQGVLTDGNGALLYECSERATWSTSNPGVYLLEASSNDLDQQITYELYRGPRQTTSVDGGFAHFSASKPFRSHVVRCPDGSCRMSFGFSPSVVITNNGAVQDADSLVIVYRSGSGATEVQGAIDEYLVLDEVPGLTIRETACVSSHGDYPYGLGTSASGNASIVPDHASRRLPVHNLGSSGQDGVSISLDATQSIDLPFSPPVPLSSFKKIEWEPRDCDDGACDASASVKCFGAGQPHPQCAVSLPNAGPRTIWVDSGDLAFDYRDLDDDNDGVFDIDATPGSEVSVARVRFRRLPDAGHAGECFIVDFGAPVTIHRSGQPPQVVDHLRFQWTCAPDCSSPALAKGKLFSVTGQPTPVGEASNERGVGQFTISEPGFETALEALDDPGVGVSMAGFPVLQTWSLATGEVRVADINRDGRPDLARSPAFIVGNDKPELGAKLIWSPHSNLNGSEMRGFGFEASYDSIGTWPDSMSVELEVSTTAFQPREKIRICHRNGAFGYQVFDGTGDPVDVTVEVYHQGALQTSSPYPVDGVDGSSPPGVIILEADLDGDGEFEPLCTNFTPGTTVTVGGGTYPCDSLVFKIGGAISQEDINSCTVRLNGLPPGEPVIGTRLAALEKRGTLLGSPLPSEAPLAFALSAAWPNPASGASALRLSLPSPSRVRTTVIDVTGRVVAKLADRGFTAGEHVLRWDGRRTGGTLAPSGLYFVRVECFGGDARVARLTRVR